jgi:hypothetical protein
MANVVAGGFILHREAQRPPVVATQPLPTVTIPVPATAAPSTPALHRAERRRAKPRPIALGTIDVAAFCVDTLAGISGARSTPDGWDCQRSDGTASAVDMNAACRWEYGSEAWGGMLDDADQKSWRCYRDPS